MQWVTESSTESYYHTVLLSKRAEMLFTNIHEVSEYTVRRKKHELCEERRESEKKVGKD